MNILKLLGIDKEQHEIDVLTEFLNCLYVGNPIEFSLESKEPPEPDILVKWKDREEYYELARILDKNLIPLRLKTLMDFPKQVKVDPSKFGLPERNIVEAKLKKEYNKNSKGLFLLLYYDIGIFNGGYPPIELNQLCNDIIKPLVTGNSIFNTIYIFDRRSGEILWKN